MSPLRSDEPTEPHPLRKLWTARTVPLPVIWPRLAAAGLLHTRWFWAAVTGCAVAAIGLLAAAAVLGPLTGVRLLPTAPARNQAVLLAPRAPVSSPPWASPVSAQLPVFPADSLFPVVAVPMDQSESPSESASIGSSAEVTAAPGPSQPVPSPVPSRTVHSTPPATSSPTYGGPWHPSPSAHTTRPAHPSGLPTSPPSSVPSTPPASTPAASTPSSTVASTASTSPSNSQLHTSSPGCLLWVAGWCIRVN